MSTSTIRTTALVATAAVAGFVLSNLLNRRSSAVEKSTGSSTAVELSKPAVQQPMSKQEKRKRAKSTASEEQKPEIIVLKIGSNSLATERGFINMQNITALVNKICDLQEKGFKVVLVTSGAVGTGCLTLGIERPKKLTKKQAVAAVGQCRLMQIYTDFFNLRDQKIAQVLLSRANTSHALHWHNAQNTMNELLELNVIPIVNENDTVAVEELRVGDNDTLSAMVASLMQAKWLFLLTDVPALYSGDPRSDPTAKAIHVVEDLSSLNVSLGGTGSSWGTGGMATKLQAARIGVAAGVNTCIIQSDRLDQIDQIIGGDNSEGTQFLPNKAPLSGSKRLIAHGLRTEGQIHIDDGAFRAIQRKKSLFAAGIVKIEGQFQAESTVSVINSKGQEVAKGVVNFNSEDIDVIKGMHSDEFENALGYYPSSEEVITRQKLALIPVAAAAN